MSTEVTSEVTEVAPDVAPEATEVNSPPAVMSAMSSMPSWSSQASRLNQVGEAMPYTGAPKKAQPKAIVRPSVEERKNKTKPAKAAKPVKPVAATVAAKPKPAPEADAPSKSFVPQEPPAPKKGGFGVVKEVLSGDTLVLMGGPPAPGQRPQFRRIIISGITAPKFGRGKQQDSPWGWHSREFLRKRVIGQKVAFAVNHTSKSPDTGSETDFCKVTLPNGENVAHIMVQNGWATVKEKAADGKGEGKGEGNEEKKEKVQPEKQLLRSFQENAKQLGLGVFQQGVDDADKVRNISRDSITREVDAKELIKSKGIPLSGVVDQVRDGSTIRVELTGEDLSDHRLITVFLAGVQAPRTALPSSVQEAIKQKDDEDGKQSREPEPVSPFAADAQFFTEARLLNRDVKVIIHGIDKSSNLFGTVLVPQGNIAIRLLENGLATLVEWTAKLTPDYDKLVAAEQAAKKARLNLFRDYSESKDAKDAKEDKEIYATITQVLSGDCVIVTTSEGIEHKFYLSSVTSPRLGFGGRNGEPYALEAKEYLRKKAIGKPAKVVVDYVREAAPGATRQEPRSFATIWVGKINVAEELLKIGLAKMSNQRPGDDRSSSYESLIAAEELAIAAKRGVHDGKKKGAPTVRIIDLTERTAAAGERKSEEVKDSKSRFDTKKNKLSEEKGEEKKKNKSAEASTRAKTWAHKFQRDTNINAVVEHVFSGSRFKVYVQKENVQFFFVLAGIRTPNRRDAKENKSDAKKDEAIAATATQLAKSLCLQHDVRIEVEDIDRNDNFVGNLYIGSRNLAVALLEEGLATIFERREPPKAEYSEAERRAKVAQKNIWVGWDEKKEEEAKAARLGLTGDADRKDFKAGEFLNFKITEIVDGANFFATIAGHSDLELINARLKELEGSTASAEFAFDRGTVCAGLFEGNFHRVRVETKVREGAAAKVTFIDFGNQCVLNADELRPLDEEVAKLSGAAKNCTLAVCKAPPATESDHFTAAAEAFNTLAWDRPLVGRVDFVSTRFGVKHHVTLNEVDATASINQQLLRNGFVQIDEKCPGPLKKLAEEWGADEAEAKRARLRIWEHGDVSYGEEEDDDLNSARGNSGRPPKRGGAAPTAPASGGTDTGRQGKNRQPKKQQ